MKLLCLTLLSLALLSHADDASSKKLNFRLSRRICFLRSDSGPCEAAIPKWFYNRKTKRCERFLYGGCKGNRNRFDSIHECVEKCGSPTIPNEKCKLEVDQGPCRAAIPRWYYDKKTRTCKLFTYGGCGGNGNNFKTKAACEKSCRRDCKLHACADPCTVTKCKRYPKAVCVPNSCNGCSAEFYFKGQLVDCGTRRPPLPVCGDDGDKCINVQAISRTDGYDEGIAPCCKNGLRCCVCGHPVRREDILSLPLKLGVCRKRCICPIG